MLLSVLFLFLCSFLHLHVLFYFLLFYNQRIPGYGFPSEYSLDWSVILFFIVCNYHFDVILLQELFWRAIFYLKMINFAVVFVLFICDFQK